MGCTAASNKEVLNLAYWSVQKGQGMWMPPQVLHRAAAATTPEQQQQHDLKQYPQETPEKGKQAITTTTIHSTLRGPGTRLQRGSYRDCDFWPFLAQTPLHGSSQIECLS